MCERKLFVKNMVCERCKMVVRDALLQLDIQAFTVQMGLIEFQDCISEKQKKLIRENIESYGFELLEDKKQRLIETIKIIIIDMIRERSDELKFNISDYLSRKLNYDYGYLSNVFSSIENISIEQYLINQKIEKVKELLIFDEISLTEMSHQLGYSSLAHLSAQFKKVTGYTASYYRSQRDVSSRKSLDNL